MIVHVRSLCASLKLQATKAGSTLCQIYLDSIAFKNKAWVLPARATLSCYYMKFLHPDNVNKDNITSDVVEITILSFFLQKQSNQTKTGIVL